MAFLVWKISTIWRLVIYNYDKFGDVIMQPLRFLGWQIDFFRPHFLLPTISFAQIVIDTPYQCALVITSATTSISSFSSFQPLSSLMSVY